MTLTTKRPRKRDADATRGELLEAATRAFAEKGFDGARIDEIAHRARVNKRMIYAYFGDKDGIYRAVLDAHLSGALALASVEAAPRGGAREQAELAIRGYFGFLAEHGDFVRLLFWEALSRERRGRQILLERLGAGVEPLHAIVRRGIEAGEIRADVDPRHLTMAVNALLLGYFNQEPLLTALWGVDQRADAARASVLDGLVRLVFDGIGARP